MRDAERMREVADIISSFPQYLPCVVLSAMGKVRSSVAGTGGAGRQRVCRGSRAPAAYMQRGFGGASWVMAGVQMQAQVESPAQLKGTQPGVC